MLVVLAVVIVAAWVGACMIRRRIHKRREAAFEMRPPTVTWNAGGTPYPGLYAGGNVAVEKNSTPPLATATFMSKGKSPLSREVEVNDSTMDNGGKEKRPK